MFKESTISRPEYRGNAIRRIIGGAGAVVLLASCGTGKSASETTPPVTSQAPATANSLPVPNVAPTPSTVVTSEAIPTPTDIAVSADTPTYEAPITDQPQETTPIRTEEAPKPRAAQPEQSNEDNGTLDNCEKGIAYLKQNAAPGFNIVCPGNAFGGQAVTCINHAPECPDEKVIIIAVPCDKAFRNEAYNSNSWSDAAGTFTRPIDPYGPSC
jgi:hypothetical protein